jgi:hypothetical protein
MRQASVRLPDQVTGPAVERNLLLSFAPFAVDSLANEARRQGVSLGALLRHAALYYLGESTRERIAVRVPRFAKDEDGGETVTVRIDLEAVDWARLERAAELEHVSVATLIQHAAMLYLSDADSGRLGARLLGVEAR